MTKCLLCQHYAAVAERRKMPLQKNTRFVELVKVKKRIAYQWPRRTA